jgi:hypothetical protein
VFFGEISAKKMITYSALSELEGVDGHPPLAGARGYSYLALSEPGKPVLHSQTLLSRN